MIGGQGLAGQQVPGWSGSLGDCDGVAEGFELPDVLRSA
jgi:hypothetical protein